MECCTVSDLASLLTSSEAIVEWKFNSLFGPTNLYIQQISMKSRQLGTVSYGVIGNRPNIVRGCGVDTRRHWPILGSYPIGVGFCQVSGQNPSVWSKLYFFLVRGQGYICTEKYRLQRKISKTVGNIKRLNNNNHITFKGPKVDDEENKRWKVKFAVKETIQKRSL